MIWGNHRRGKGEGEVDDSIYIAVRGRKKEIVGRQADMQGLDRHGSRETVSQNRTRSANCGRKFAAKNGKKKKSRVSMIKRESPVGSGKKGGSKRTEKSRTYVQHKTLGWLVGLPKASTARGRGMRYSPENRSTLIFAGKGKKNKKTSTIVALQRGQDGQTRRKTQNDRERTTICCFRHKILISHQRLSLYSPR